jgi:hypothetical protein
MAPAAFDKQARRSGMDGGNNEACDRPAISRGAHATNHYNFRRAARIFFNFSSQSVPGRTMLRADSISSGLSTMTVGLGRSMSDFRAETPEAPLLLQPEALLIEIDVIAWQL